MIYHWYLYQYLYHTVEGLPLGSHVDKVISGILVKFCNYFGPDKKISMMYHQWVEYEVSIGSQMATGEEKTRIEILRKKIWNVGLIEINDILISLPGRIGRPIPGSQQDPRLWSSAGPLYRSAARRSRRSCRGWGWCTLTVTSFSVMLLVVSKQLEGVQQKLPHFQILSIFTWTLG